MATDTRSTEADSNYDGLEKKTVQQLLTEINKEDVTVALAVQKCIPQITILCQTITDKLKQTGRLFYIGAGTSGRLGILDAAEIPPTYGIEDLVIATIAGGGVAIQHAVENAEDDLQQGWLDLQKNNINEQDVLVGIAASGSTPYVLNALVKAKENNIATGCIVCNLDSQIAKACDFPIEIETGPEYVTGSTRMKAGTAQKLVLNMISTTVMIQLGRVKGNKMVEMKLSNQKLYNRAVQIVMDELGIGEKEATSLLDKEKHINRALALYRSSKS